MNRPCSVRTISCALTKNATLGTLQFCPLVSGKGKLGSLKTAGQFRGQNNVAADVSQEITGTQGYRSESYVLYPLGGSQNGHQDVLCGCRSGDRCGNRFLGGTSFSAGAYPSDSHTHFGLRTTSRSAPRSFASTAIICQRNVFQQQTIASLRNELRVFQMAVLAGLSAPLFVSGRALDRMPGLRYVSCVVQDEMVNDASRTS